MYNCKNKYISKIATAQARKCIINNHNNYTNHKNYTLAHSQHSSQHSQLSQLSQFTQKQHNNNNNNLKNYFFTNAKRSSFNTFNTFNTNNSNNSHNFNNNLNNDDNSSNNNHNRLHLQQERSFSGQTKMMFMEKKQASYRRDFSIPRVLSQAIESNYLTEDNPIAMFVDLSHFNERCKELQRSFKNAGICNDNITHTFAVKALPLPAILNEARSLGFGTECASKGEIDISIEKANISNNKIIFDSPCKTINELKYCLNNNISFNIDNFQELDRVAAILNNNNNNFNDFNDSFDNYRSYGSGVGCNIGIRVNPSVGNGKIDATSTATADSKFGINIEQYRDDLRDAYMRYPWLNSIHCHIGSQGCPVEQLVNGIYKIVEFVEDINGLIGARKIQYIDIGGGLPINYDSNEIKPTFNEFVTHLKQKVPKLFQKINKNNKNNSHSLFANNGKNTHNTKDSSNKDNNSNKYHIVTEFGRSLVQKSGWIASRVEYTKKSGNKNIAIIHAGANLFVRTAYSPHIWKHEITVHGPDGQPKCNNYDKSSNNSKNSKKDLKYLKYDIAGPLCFSGDYVARDIELPEIKPGDYLVIHDTGGYTYGMYSRYNSRYAPGIYAYRSDNGNNGNNGKNTKEFDIDVVKRAETSQDIFDFWR